MCFSIFTLYIYDYDYKRIFYLFLTLTKEDGTLASTNEVMMMGINQHTRRSDAFSLNHFQHKSHYYKNQSTITWPETIATSNKAIPAKEH